MLKNFIILIFFYNSLQKADVFFTREITSSSLVKIFKKLNVKLTGNIGLKVHTGEPGGLYFLTPDFLQEIYNYTNGTFIECNCAYNRSRHSTELHKKILHEHGWLDKDRRTVIMDENPLDDFNLTVEDPIVLKENIVGAHLREFDSCLVLAHWKGHPAAGFGGTLKQLSIGFASQSGKTWIHTGGQITDWTHMLEFITDQISFTNAMGDASSSIVKYFRERGGIAFINVIANISLWCDCGGGLSPPPKINDIGIVASTDPVAIDRASIDLIKEHLDIGTTEMLEQIKELYGENVMTAAEKHKIGTQEYNLIDIDQKEQLEDEEEVEKNKDKDNNYTLLIIIILSIFAVLLIIGFLGFVIYRTKRIPKEITGKISLADSKIE